jgi:AcrR family transcriptional regulator
MQVSSSDTRRASSRFEHRGTFALGTVVEGDPMTRLQGNRTTELSAEEIAAEALRQFDEGGAEPGIASLAAALGLQPTDIERHFGSRAEIIRAAVAEVWKEALVGLLQLTPKPLEAEPRRVLVAMGIASRRAWLAHYRLAPYLAASPEVDDFTRNSIGIMADLLERVGLEGEAAAAAFHSYTSFMIGSALFAATRANANEQFTGDPHGDPKMRFRTEHSPAIAQRSTEPTRQAIDRMMELSAVDPARDEELYARGLRRLVESLTSVE